MDSILHVVDSIELISGGLGLAALRLSEAQSYCASKITLLVNRSSRHPVFESLSDASSRCLFVPSKIQNCAVLAARSIWVNGLLREIEPRAVHLHGVWSPFLFEVALIAHLRGIPFFISPHGCYEPWSLKQKAFKKKIALYSYQGWLNRHAHVLFATSEQEVASISNLRIGRPIALIPNGVDIPKECFLSNPSERENIILFMSRIHPKKGLLELIHAWRKVGKPDWRVVIAGPDEGGYKAVIEKEILKSDLGASFSFAGLVTGAEKLSLFNRAKIFILPTQSENFGIVIGEALAHSIPVITTTGAPWSELVDYDCGWWVHPNVEQIALALDSAMRTPDRELAHMGERGRRLVVDKYGWASVARRSLDIYEWALFGGNRPDFIF